jgi:hypothetical protein
MQYYVIGPDGSKYGPADIPTLKQWAAENRLNPDAVLEDFNTGQRTTAAQVQGIFEAGAPGAPIPTTTATTDAQRGQMAQQLPSGSAGPSLYDSPTGNMAPGYYQRDNKDGDAGKVWIILSWVMSAIGIIGCCTYIFSPLGIIFAFVGGAQGYTKSMPAKIFSIVSLVVGMIILILTRAAFLEWAQSLQRGAPH